MCLQNYSSRLFAATYLQEALWGFKKVAALGLDIVNSYSNPSPGLG
jgi:hypothetical protein